MHLKALISRPAFWLPFLSQIFLAIGLVLLALATTGMHRSSLAYQIIDFLRVAFPFARIFTGLGKNVFTGFAALIVGFGQFPFYGFVLGYFNVNRQSPYAMLAAGFVGAHLLVMLFYGIYLAFAP